MNISSLPELIYLDEDQTDDDVHHGGVELKAQVGRTRVKDSAHQALSENRYQSFLLKFHSIGGLTVFDGIKGGGAKIELLAKSENLIQFHNLNIKVSESDFNVTKLTRQCKNISKSIEKVFHI